jgi:hypothetical protein
MPATPALPPTATLPNDTDIAGGASENPAEVASVAAPDEANAASMARRIRLQDVLERGRSRRAVRR